MSGQSLMDALNFTLEDLEANRGGQISQAQQKKLKRLRITSMSVPVLSVLVSILILQIAVSDYSKYNEPSRLVLIFLALMLVIVAAGFAVHRWQRISPDLHSTYIEVINGIPSLSGINVKGFGYYSASYPMTIDEQTILLPYQARSLIDESKVYRFYLTPRVKIILAIEEIASTK